MSVDLSRVPLDRVGVDVLDAVTLPPQAYFSREWYLFELEEIFSKEWVGIGHVGQVPNPGDFFTFTIGSDPFITVRGDDHVIRTISAVCRHRGMLVESGVGRRSLFMCPYHAWTYDLCGKMIGAPNMTKTHDFNKSDIALPAVRTEVWKGLIFVNLDEQARPLIDTVVDFEPLVANYRIEDLVMARRPDSFDLDMNWKIWVENATECYHCATAHKEFAVCTPASSTIPDRLQHNDSLFAVTLIQSHIDAAWIPPDFKALFPPLPHLTDEERFQFNIFTIPPATSIILTSDNVHFTCAFPIGPTKSRSTTGIYLYPQSTLDLPDFDAVFERQASIYEKTFDQDVVIGNGVQSGMQSRYAPQGRLSWTESHLAKFDRWLVKRYERARDGVSS